MVIKKFKDIAAAIERQNILGDFTKEISESRPTDNTVESRKEKILEVKDLYKHYGNVLVLKGVTFTIYEGDCVGVVGINGAGKSTLLKTIMKLTDHTSGSIKVCGTERYNPGQIGMLWDDSGHFLYKTVANNYQIECGYHDIEYDRAAVIKLLDEFNVGTSIDTTVIDLSTGMSRKTGIMKVFMKYHRLKLLDEPCSSLDMEAQNKFAEILKTQLRNSNSAAMLITHRFEDIEQVCNKLLILNDGRVYEYGTITAVKRRHLNYIIAEITRLPSDIDLENKILTWVEKFGFKHASLTNSVSRHVTHFIKIPQKQFSAAIGILTQVNTYAINVTVYPVTFPKFIHNILKGVTFDE